MISYMKNSWKKIRSENPDDSIIDSVFRALSGVRDIVLAKWYLRKCKTGVGVRTRGRPRIKNQGTIGLSNEVRIWSNIVRSKLLVGPNAELSVGKKLTY